MIERERLVEKSTMGKLTDLEKMERQLIERLSSTVKAEHDAMERLRQAEEQARSPMR